MDVQRIGPPSPEDLAVRREHWDDVRIQAARLFADQPGVSAGARNIIWMLCTEVERLKEELAELELGD